MGEETTNGVSHLVALKQHTGDHPATDQARVNRYAPAITTPSQSFAGREKRRSPRYKCEGSAELREEDRDVRAWVTFTDVSLHGCYAEAANTYPLGTRLHVKLEAKGFQVFTKGTVRVSYPGLGMGIGFSEMSDENRARLRDMLSAIMKPSIASGVKVSTPAAAGENSAATADATAVLRSLAEYFENRQMLAREEFQRIISKNQI